MSDRTCRRVPQRQRLALAGYAIVSSRLGSGAAYRPELIGEMLFEQGDLRLRGEHDVGESSRGSAIRRHAGQHPGAALLIHEAARAVEGVHENAPAAIRFARAL